MILAWTYPISFYLNKNGTQTFENCQRALGIVCQQLHIILDFQSACISENLLDMHYLLEIINQRY